MRSALIRAAGLAAVVVAVAIQPAAAEGAIEMQALLNDDGSGSLFVNNPGESWSWEACAPNLSSCTPFGAGREISTAGAAPNTVFRVSGEGDTGLSPLWHGAVFPLAPPTVGGIVRANELVTPVAGGWAGGWENEKDAFQLAACKTPAPDGCMTLTHPNYPGECRNTAVVLDPALTGRYLRVTDRRIGPGPHYMLLYAVGSPYGHELWDLDARTSAAVVGRIGRATGPRTDNCGPPPLNTASISKRGVATVECGLGCDAVLIAKRGNRAARIARRLPRPKFAGARSPVTLRLPSGARVRLGPGRARAVVKIDGRRAAHRAVFLGEQPKR